MMIQFRHYAAAALALTLAMSALVVRCACTSGGNDEQPEATTAVADSDIDEEPTDADTLGVDTVFVNETLPIDTINPFDTHLDSMPDGGCVKMKINSIGGTLGRVFNDSNYLHVNEARRIGLRPIEGLRDVWHLRRPVRRIVSCREYVVDTLTHSHPYLVPEAAQLLSDIGARFNDSLQARGGGAYRLKVTSILRTKHGVQSLRRRNGNAIEESAHRFGTTFDISYAKFICDSATTVNRTQEDLKNLLGEVLFAMRNEKRCFVKYERKQACFHITTRTDAAIKPQKK